MRGSSDAPAAVLLVEDDSDNRDLMREILEGMGLEVAFHQRGKPVAEVVKGLSRLRRFLAIGPGRFKRHASSRWRTSASEG